MQKLVMLVPIHYHIKQTKFWVGVTIISTPVNEKLRKLPSLTKEVIPNCMCIPYAEQITNDLFKQMHFALH